jgi:hypothetical protein
VVVNRTLSVIFNPNRYRSKAAAAFTEEILPQFTNLPLNFKAIAAEKSTIEKNGAKPSSPPLPDAYVSPSTSPPGS